VPEDTTTLPELEAAGVLPVNQVSGFVSSYILKQEKQSILCDSYYGGLPSHGNQICLLLRVKVVGTFALCQLLRFHNNDIQSTHSVLDLV